MQSLFTVNSTNPNLTLRSPELRSDSIDLLSALRLLKYPSSFIAELEYSLIITRAKSAKLTPVLLFCIKEHHPIVFIKLNILYY